MMYSTNDLRKRGEISNRVENLKTDITKSESNLETYAKDVEVIKNSLKKLDFASATSEGSGEINDHIEAAEDITKEEFKKEDDVLERKQHDSSVFERDLSHRNEHSEKNIDKVSDAEKAIKTKETLNELNKAKKAVLKDIDFLMKQIDRAKKERERSDKVQKKLKAKIR